ncbi:hypothetical protein ES703_79115 [subsurface metagenome]
MNAHLIKTLNALFASPRPEAWSGYPFDLIGQLVKEMQQRFPTDPAGFQATPIMQIYVAARLTPPGEFQERFPVVMRWALSYGKTPAEAYRSIVRDLFTPEIREEYFRYKPVPDRMRSGNPEASRSLPQDIPLRSATWAKRARVQKCLEAWRLTDQWGELTKSDKLVIQVLWGRVAYPKGPGLFPWCLGGVQSLAGDTGYSGIQVKRALVQLQEKKLIHRFFRAYEGQGASKYHVFLTPKMSRAFSWQVRQRSRLRAAHGSGRTAKGRGDG